jgi:DNA invertase Pin-like site-specific DNA recombinase
LYARVSTSDGRQNAGNQLTVLRQWADRLGGNILEEYVDEASGSKADRMALNRLMDDAHKRKFDVVLIWALDRMSREGIARLSGYLERLKACGVRVLSHQEPWLDTAGPVADLLIAIFGWVAQQERSRIRERVLAGLETAKARGKKLGRPIRSIDLGKASLLRSQGHSVRLIAQVLGIPKSTVARLLSQKPLAVAA